MRNLKFTLLIIISLITTLFSCKKDYKNIDKQPDTNISTKDTVATEQQTPQVALFPVEITLKNIKSRDSVKIGKHYFYTKKTTINTTFSDSLNINKRIILNEEAKTEKLTFNIPKNEVINISIDASFEKYNYFLQSGDNLIIDFNKNGFISKSNLNGKDNDVALIFSKNLIPDKKTEYIKAIRANKLQHFNDIQFEREFEKSFQNGIRKVTVEIEVNKHNLPPIVYTALKNNLTFTNIKNEYTKGNAHDIQFDDTYLNLNSYRKLSNYILYGINNNIDFIDDEKYGISEAFKTFTFLTTNDSLKKNIKTRNLILKELINTVGQYNPNLIPEFIAKIPNTTLREQFLKNYTNDYLLELTEKRNDKNKLNILSFNKNNQIATFKEFLEENKNKVIYVDLWASWCGPCKNQMRASHNLRKELSEKGVIFAYFSIDKSFADWKTASIEEEIDGYASSFLVLNTKTSELYKSWNVKGVPRYLIFNKQGKLVNNKAPFPTNEETKKLLLEYANK